VEDDEVLTSFILECRLPPKFTGGRVFDDRGLTYLRHGEPQRKANFPGLAHFTTESWAYSTDSSTLVIHFGQMTSNPLVGMSARPLAGGDWMSACQVTPLYCVLASRESL